MRITYTAIIAGLLLTAMTTIACAAGAKGINERILVIHSTSSSQKDKDPELQPRLSVYDGIVEYMSDKGYRIVDKAAAEQCSLQVAATHDIDPVLNKAASFGLKYFSEYTVYFNTATIIKDREDSKGALIRVNAKVVDNTSCQIVTSKATEASSSGMSMAAATDKAGRSAGKKLAAALSTALENYLHESARSGRIYTVIIESSASSQNPLNLLTKLEQIPAISAARESESGGGKTTFEISYIGKRDQLDRDLIKVAGELGWKLAKIRSEGNRSTWIIK